jgi:hypothetical protein
MDKSDPWLTGYLHWTCFSTELQNNGSNLGSARGTNGMAF